MEDNMPENTPRARKRWRRPSRICSSIRRILTPWPAGPAIPATASTPRMSSSRLSRFSPDFDVVRAALTALALSRAASWLNCQEAAPGPSIHSWLRRALTAVFIDPISDSVERTWTHNAPFGDWRYIRQRMIESVSRRLDLSQRLFPRQRLSWSESEPWMTRPPLAC